MLPLLPLLLVAAGAVAVLAHKKPAPPHATADFAHGPAHQSVTMSVGEPLVVVMPAADKDTDTSDGFMPSHFDKPRTSTLPDGSFAYTIVAKAAGTSTIVFSTPAGQPRYTLDLTIR